MQPVASITVSYTHLDVYKRQAPHDTAIIDEVNKVTVEDIKFKGNKDLIQIIGEDVDKVYLDLSLIHI